MSYRAEPKGSMKSYLQQRSAEEAASERAKITAQHMRAVEFMNEYRARGRRTAFNWSPTITVTKIEETTSEEIHHEEGQADQPQAAEVGISEGVGDAAEEREAPGIAGGPDERGVLRGQGGHEQPDGIRARFAREGHTDFGDGDTPF